MAQRVSLKSFLTTARKALTTPASQRPNPLTFVVGNESADLDSICSAVLYAYFRTHAPSSQPTLHIPLSNLPRADLALRTELNAIFPSSPNSVTPDDLITLSDLPSPSDLPPASTKWYLVDHNVLTGDLSSRGFDKSIAGCVDHHEDEHVIPSDAQPRVFAKCGSCMSLVLSQCQPIWDQLESHQEIDQELAKVAMAPILIDTVNLTSKDKTTDWDIKAAQYAEQKLVPTLGSSRTGSSSERYYVRGKYFDRLSELKDSILHLSYRDILRKDYKRWSDGSLNLGISTVVQGFETCLAEVGDKQTFLTALRDWAREQDLDIAAVMTVSKPGGIFTRELLVCALGGQEATKVARRFVEKNGEALGLERWKDGALDGEEDTEWRACWRQMDVGSSRKQVAPMLREVMKESARL
ncbi:putative Exopolyphosphatase [Triangularia verruculosa]|uniref:Exopolyphosphatase n=1 Tax=Triangularia verruculosa TaxID=2587418 RepID=A0AAN7AVP4_9PEZI|nr:putative Exopolyphosphatase [Triangularia verruculosa]